MNHSSNSTELRDFKILNMVNLYVNDILGSIIFTFGILFNILSFTYFQLSRSFRDTSMRHYFSVLSITDSLRLSEWLFLFLLNKKVIFLSKGLCSGFLFLTITSGHISVWLLVFLSIERFIILQFPFRGKQFYTTRNSLKMLCVVILLFILADIPYLLPDFYDGIFVLYEYHVHMCLTNKIYRSYMFINNVIVYSLIPFVLLLVFNCLLIALLARRNNQLFNVIQCENVVMNAKRERQFKERTVLLISVTFFLVLTVSPRYIAQMVFVFLQYGGVLKAAISKCLFVLEMLNFGVNFLFYIICSKTSRNELYLILYYFFYWKWSKNSRKYVICNHPNHNKNGQYSANSRLTNATSYSNAPSNTAVNDYEPSFSVYNMSKNSRFKIHCFLTNAYRIKNLESRRSSIMSTFKEVDKNKVNNSLANNNNNNKLNLPTRKFSSLKINGKHSNESDQRNIHLSSSDVRYMLGKAKLNEKKGGSNLSIEIISTKESDRFLTASIKRKSSELTFKIDAKNSV